MRIGIVTPAPPRSRHGNRVTALRWARLLKELGHRVSIAQDYRGEPLDLLIALHARRSFSAIKRFHKAHPDRPVVVALTGTDVYRDLKRSKRARQSLELASRIVVLQPKALEKLDARLRSKASVIYQSVKARSRRKRASASSRFFDVCVIGHLREVKDPFRAAMAARSLRALSRIRVVQVGGAMSAAMAARARREVKTNERYRWLGEVAPWRVREVLMRSRLCVLSSKLEGGANALSEAIVAGVPVLASRISGNVGILGEDYPGYFEVGGTEELGNLMHRAETDVEFLDGLRRGCANVAHLFKEEREKAAWSKLVEELDL